MTSIGSNVIAPCTQVECLSYNANIFETQLSIEQRHLLFEDDNSDFISLLTLPPCISIMINIKGCDSLPGSEARGALGTVPCGLHTTLYLHPSRSPPKSLRFF